MEEVHKRVCRRIILDETYETNFNVRGWIVVILKRTRGEWFEMERIGIL